MSPLMNAHALVVGIADYQNIDTLPSVVIKDAQDVYDLLVDPSHCGYDKNNATLLINEQATRGALRQAFENLAERSDEDATILLFFSGHGGHIKTGSYAGEYLLPVDVDCSSSEAIAQTSISGEEFSQVLRTIKARKVVVIFDACHSGGIGQPKDHIAPELKALPEEYYAALAKGWGRVILASSRSTESSFVLGGASNSLFTQHLLEGLKGGAPSPDGMIRIFDLFHYLQPRVTKDHPDQHPIFKAEVEDNFPIALYLGGKAPKPEIQAQSEDRFQYDVFISYKQQDPDKIWVRKTLLPQLKAAGVRVLTNRDFRLGAPKVTEMARAVEESRYTLAILSPAYLESNFSNLETILAEHLGLENSQHRLLAIMRETCEPRLGMRVRMGLDMTDDDEFEDNLSRLVFELRQVPEM